MGGGVMKKVLVFALPLLLLSVSCEKIEQLFPRTTGSEIVFGHSSTFGSNTKAYYAGEFSGVYEIIKWSTYDSIRIYCSQAEKPSEHYADYFVSEGSTSSAKIDHNPNSVGLRWGAPNTLHEFAALYPSPAHGISGTAVTEGSVTCVLPDAQTYSGITYRITGNKSPKAEVNPKYLYLAGYGSAKSSNSEGEGGDAVNLFFDPAFTAFEFTLQNNYGEGEIMDIERVGITTQSGNLAAKYTAGVTGISESTHLVKDKIDTIATTGRNTIYMKFPTVQTIAYGDSITFTLFVQPKNDITKLTFWMKDKDGNKRSFEFKYENPSDPRGEDGWVKFTALHKSKIRGLLAPKSAGWTINTMPMVAEWGQNPEDLEIESGNVISFTSPVVVTWTDEDQGSITYSE